MEDKEYKLNDLFLDCMCKRFVDIPKTKILILNGKEVFARIRRRIVDSDVPFICNFLRTRPNIVSVNLAYNNISNEGISSIADFLKDNSTLVELNLMNNDITADGVMKLAELKNEMTLKSLRINGNKIGSKGLQSLALILTTCDSLINLDVGETDMDIGALVYFATVLRTNSTLQSICLSRVLSPPGHLLQTDHVAQVLQQTLVLNSTLRDLELQKIGFLDHDIEILVMGLKRNSTILLLDLSCNSFGDVGLEHISEYLALKPPLRTLLVNKNHIGDNGARALSYNFPSSNLEYLDISHNKMTDQGLLHILNYLKKERPLIGLYLRGNNIGAVTCKVLYRMILSGALQNINLDVEVYQDKNTLEYKYSEIEVHLRSHYYCLCANTNHKHCRHCTIMEIRNKK